MKSFTGSGMKYLFTGIIVFTFSILGIILNENHKSNQKSDLVEDARLSVSDQEAKDNNIIRVANDLSSHNDEQLAKIIEELNRLSHRMKGLENRVGRISDNREIPLRLEDPATVEEQTIAHENYVDEFNHVFFSEEVDPDWSNSAEDSLRMALDSVQEMMPEMIVHEISCLSTLCRANYQLPSEDGLQQNVHKIGNSLGWESKSFVEYKVSEQGKVLVESFYMRENFDYPEFAENAP